MTDPWLAAESFVSPEPQQRREGLAALTATDRVRFSPLVTFLLVSRLDEQDLALRKSIVEALASCFEMDGPLYVVPRETRDDVSSWLSRFGRQQVERLLQVASAGSVTEPELGAGSAVVTLLDRIPDVSALLTRIAADRLTPFATRFAAIAALGEIGAVDALPALAGLKTRIEGQKAGQLAMAFAPAPNPDDDRLLDVLGAAMQALRENE